VSEHAKLWRIAMDNGPSVCSTINSLLDEKDIVIAFGVLRLTPAWWFKMPWIARREAWRGYG
jgi:hypothetical protein